MVHGGSGGAVNCAPDIAGCSTDGQSEEEQQQPGEDGTDDSGGGDPHGQLDHGEQDRPQNARKQSADWGAAACGSGRHTDGGGQNPQIHHGNAEGNPEECRGDGDDPRDLQERGDNADDGCGDRGSRSTADPAGTIGKIHIVH